MKVKDLEKYDSPLVGFDGKLVVLEGQIKFPIVAKGERGDSEFHSCECDFPIHGNLGKALDTCHGRRAIHTACESKFPIEDGVVVMRGDQKVAC